MNKEELTNIVKDVVFNDEKYTQYYVSKFGINQGNFNNYRNGKRNIEGMQLKTVLKLIDVYNSKQ
ncbi:hypothetical protein AKUA2003_PHAGE200040 (plasmid) [Apilactobacillus kunkeei]|nr:hypothetical protein AKUA1001_PHAGE200040 [Apilactobacillus kunkeei]CAI2669741.1 hypothetical protein AKUA2003_PHAGE200040 [Apilactobacillus kunkeei]CAI2803552.1 hypothetical protein AKUA2002_PHAGE200040 [Apilactobacillus kunkeei]